MDPNACVERLLNAVQDQDYEEAQAAAEDLLGWLSREGFPPDAAHVAKLALAVHMLAALREEG